ncbi:MAG: hypothetical protein BroJett014_27720 [Planctomycetota bacterium]|nr:MAG: hypothetical protein BroJett014_27720 [Planctomycetota bacterium]
MNKTIVACIAFAIAVGAVVTWVFVTRTTPEVRTAATTVSADRPAETWRERVLTPKEGKTPAEVADLEFNNLTDAKQRKELIEWVAGQPWADHKTPVLRKAMIADTNEEVQLAALDKSVQLADSKGTPAISDVVRAGLSAGNPKVVQQSLREARKHPCVELVPDLLEVADSSAAHRFLAVDALAFTDDPRARSKVIEVASREDGDKTERVRAIALLVKIKDVRADEVLAQLCGSSDPEIKAVAVEAMAARDKK